MGKSARQVLATLLEGRETRRCGAAGGLAGRLALRQDAPPAGVIAHAEAILEQHWCVFEQAYGVYVSTTSMRRAIARLGWTRKKQMGAAERSEAALVV